ncbi:MAG: hypothetical protein ACW99U_17150 [Candidatus Thorarchaeota archaeon]|jgi:hypothetical protein
MALSTRDRIKSEARKIDSHLYGILANLKRIDELGMNRSAVITCHVPLLVEMIGEVSKVMTDFEHKL